jgi:hypothetical protein
LRACRRRSRRAGLWRYSAVLRQGGFCSTWS